MSWSLSLSTALIAGLSFGYCAQRGGFCLTRALSNVVLMRDTAIARAYILALIVAVVGTHLLPFGLVEEIPVRPFRWVANLVGGFTFGIGMILGGGCAGSSWYRLGEGALGAWIVLFGFAMGATATNVGVLRPVREALQQHEVLAVGPATLDHLLGVGPWPVIAVLVAAAAIWLARGGIEPEHGKWRWPVTGAVMGGVITLGWYLSSWGGSLTGITFAANTGHLLTYPLVGFPSRVTWSMILLGGVTLGSALAAWRSREFAWKAAPPGFTSVRLFTGGVVMGVGALIADGCNITQGLTNSATLALGSLTAFGAMIAGGWVTLWVMFLRR